MSNTGFNRLVNTSTDANGDSRICANCNQLFIQTEVSTNMLDHVI